jgi:hypothetical protein
MRNTCQAVIGVVWRQEPNVVPLTQKLLRESLNVPTDTARVRVRVRRHEPYAHQIILVHRADCATL